MSYVYHHSIKKDSFNKVTNAYLQFPVNGLWLTIQKLV